MFIHKEPARQLNIEIKVRILSCLDNSGPRQIAQKKKDGIMCHVSIVGFFKNLFYKDCAMVMHMAWQHSCAVNQGYHLEKQELHAWNGVATRFLVVFSFSITWTSHVFRGSWASQCRKIHPDSHIVLESASLALQMEIWNWHLKLCISNPCGWSFFSPFFIPNHTVPIKE